MSAIDATTGTIALAWDGGADPAGAMMLGPATQREAFLASPLGARAAPLVKNEPWCSWQVPGLRIGGLPFALGAYFHGAALSSLGFALIDKRFGSSWDDWSEEKERARDAAHKAWLVVQLGPSDAPNALRSYPWGSVSAGYDSKGGGSSIWIRYGADPA
jgi:hypothetical protein